MRLLIDVVDTPEACQMNRLLCNVKRWIPPAVDQILRPIFKRGVYFRGRYDCWGDAERNSSKYSDPEIFAQVTTAALQVYTGQAIAERDSVILDRLEPPWPLLATCLLAFAQKNSALNVLDFGGSLGSTFFQCRPFLPPEVLDSWNVVEQQHFARFGREQFCTERLNFFDSILEYRGNSSPDVVLASGVLQYLSDPDSAISALINMSPPYIVIDRTPFSIRGGRFVTVQEVPARIYRSSYPCWVFDRDDFIGRFAAEYFLLTSFPALDGEGISANSRFSFEGMIFARRKELP